MSLESLKYESRAAEFVAQFRDLGPDVGPKALVATWRKLPVVTRAAIAANWRFWARSKQLPPAGEWNTWGFLTGRGFGKTWAVSHVVNEEVQAGRARLILLCAQDEQSSIDIQVQGPSGLIATAPPWAKPAWEASAMRLVWPNGSVAYVRTPEAPGKIRGLEYQLAWISELQSWPTGTREEALSNVWLSVRKGASRVVWDATPKRRHPLLKEMLARAEADPTRNVVVRGTTHENAANLGAGYVTDLERRYGGTAKGREELYGEMLEDADGALWRSSWIEQKRAPLPASLLRRVVSIDPAVSSRKGSDTTGLVEAALGADGRAYVLANATGKYEVAKWCSIALDWYVQHQCDLLIAETNKGGDMVASNLRSFAKELGLEVVVIDRDAEKHPRPRWQPGKVWVLEVYARGAKEERAEPVATAYERGRVSHVLGVDLSALEDTLTTWIPEPNADSPGDMDALVHALVELLKLNSHAADPTVGFAGITQVAQAIAAPQKPSSIANSFATVLRGAPDRFY